MNSNSEIEQEEKQKLQETKDSLQNVHDINVLTINTMKGKLKHINENVEFSKKYLQYLERRIEGLSVEVEDIEWNQTKARTVLRSDREFIEQFLNNIPQPENEHYINYLDEEAVSRRIKDLEDEMDVLQSQCSMQGRVILQIQNEYKKIKEECLFNEGK